ncbi:MAG: LTA synthase family protein [Flavobacterium psychrophilum]
MNFIKKTSPFYTLTLFYLVISIISRIVLLFHPITQSSFSGLELLKIFFVGSLSDALVFVVASAFLWVYLLFLSNNKFNKPYGFIIFGCLSTLLLYVYFFNTILNEYGGSLPEIAISFIALKTILFGLLLFLPKYRSQIRLALFSFTIFLFVLLIVQNAISEYFFWNEFGVRYNFIAVDYLVYTNEVIGNIMQSYPVVPIFGSLFIVTAAITYFIVKQSKEYLDNLPTFTEKIKLIGVYTVLVGLAFLGIPKLASAENSQNIFANELQANGLYKFYLAFTTSELDYFKFYKTLPEQQAEQLVASNNPIGNPKSTAAELRKNVVLITIESLSADFMKTYGNDKNITPFLDSLATKSLLFTNLYAVGNRTVRGLEAVTLCLPPTPGESVVKRQDNKNKFTTGSVFAQKGYTVKYLYGGDAFFDNMEDFFGGNNYGIVDKKTLLPNEISFANVWGVCDEDMAKKAIRVMNEEAKLNKPFFNHWMTVSNHRPFTYPNGKIDIPGDAKSRDGGVKYTDYALRQFFNEAKKQAWYNNTVFVIVSDHCASSSGKTELPLDKYRIPALIFSPELVAPQHYSQLMSQIDVMPTLFGLLHFSFSSKFYGQNVLDKNYKPRALIATYQNLGLIKDNVLTILSPKQAVKQLKLTPRFDIKLGAAFQLNFDQELLKTPREDLINETISYYQTASARLKNKRYNAN